MTVSAFRHVGPAKEARPHPKPYRHDKVAQAPTANGMLRVLTCGSVDDGKSTLIGRLIWEAADLPDDTRATIAASAGPDGIPDVSLLLDGLEAERAQGITIDIAWRYFDLASRRYVIIDCPGHEQYTRNMATGASQADMAILLVDARHGIKQQTRRHAAILQLVGARTIVLAVNKMDLVDWSERRFQAIAAEFEEIACKSGFLKAVAIPVSARLGDNVTRRSARTSWFSGPTLLSALKASECEKARDDLPFRFPVQTIVRDGHDFRGLAGTVVSGKIARGDEVVEMHSGKRARVARIVTFDGDRSAAAAGAAVAIELDSDLDISRGGLLARPASPARLLREVEARLVWLSDLPPAGAGLLLRTATDLVPVSSFAVTARLDLESLIWQQARDCGVNDVVDVRISLGRATALDRFEELAATGSFILVDALSGGTVAGGIVKGGEKTSARREGKVFHLSRALLAATVCADLSSGEASRQEFRRRAAEVAFLLSAAGVSVDLENFDDAPMEDGGSGI